jgi:hypothetical protein
MLVVLRAQQLVHEVPDMPQAERADVRRGAIEIS